MIDKTTRKEFSWERMAAAVDAVHERAVRAARALANRQIPYAVVGDNAVAAWVSRVDAEAVRNTADVDLLIRRADLPEVIEALLAAGFQYQNVNGIDLFLDGPNGSVRSAIHVVYANEKVRPDHLLPAPEVTDIESAPEFEVITLDSLVRMKLTAMRLKDQVHLIDLLDVGLIDATWIDRVPVELRERMIQVIEQREREA